MHTTSAVLVTLLAATLLVQPVSPKPSAIETAHVTVSPTLSPALLPSSSRPGAKLSLFVDVTPKAKMHLYAPGEKDGIPVALTIDPNPAVRLSPAAFPPAEKFFFEPLKLTQLVFSKPFRITQDVTIAARPAGALTITGSFRYQACDDSVCYLPKTVPIEWTVAGR